jgi:hypothetical protein
MSNAISIEDFLSFQNCHHQRQRQVFTVFSPVETPLKNLGVASVTRFSYATEVIDSHCFSVSKEKKNDFLSGLSFFHSHLSGQIIQESGPLQLCSFVPF